MTESSTPATGFVPTAAQLTWMRDELAQQFPDLAVSVAMRGDVLHVEAVPGMSAGTRHLLDA